MMLIVLLLMAVHVPEKWNTSPVYSVIKTENELFFSIMNNKNIDKKYFFNP